MHLEKMQKRVEENESKNENKIKEIHENNVEGRTWADITNTTEKRTVEETMEYNTKIYWLKERYQVTGSMLRLQENKENQVNTDQ